MVKNMAESSNAEYLEFVESGGYPLGNASTREAIHRPQTVFADACPAMTGFYHMLRLIL